VDRPGLVTRVAGRPLRYDQRPDDDTPVTTEQLPATPVRDRNIKATAWVDAPPSLLALGDDLPDRPVADYKRRIGEWLLWRAGPASGGDARYWAARPDALDQPVTLRLFPDGSGDGVGADGARHDRFRAWKQSLLGPSEGTAGGSAGVEEGGDDGRG
jgi:hypothetical protein